MILYISITPNVIQIKDNFVILCIYFIIDLKQILKVFIIKSVLKTGVYNATD